MRKFLRLNLTLKQQTNKSNGGGLNRFLTNPKSNFDANIRSPNPQATQFSNELYKWQSLPIILTLGLITNLILIILIKRKYEPIKQPIRLIILAITLSDIVYLINELNIWSFQNYRVYHLTAINGICQLYSYLYYYFTLLNECHFILANILILKLLYPKKFHNFYNPIVIQQPNQTDEFLEQQQRDATLKRQQQEQMKSNYFFKAYTYRTYGNFVFKEKLFIILYSFVFMYLLSFLFWIQSVKSVRNTAAASLTEASAKYFNICFTYKFARLFFNIFLLAVLLIRFVNFLFNICLAFIYFTKTYFFYVSLKHEKAQDYTYNLSFLKGNEEKFSKFFCCEYACVNNADIVEPAIIKHRTATTASVYNTRGSGCFNGTLKQSIKSHIKHLKYVQFYVFTAVFYGILSCLNLIVQCATHLHTILFTYSHDSVSLLLRINYNIFDTSLTNIFSTLLLDFNEKNYIIANSGRGGHAAISSIDGFIYGDQQNVSPSSSSSGTGSMNGFRDFLLLFQNENFEMFSHFLEIFAHSFKLILYLMLSKHYRIFCRKRTSKL